jgi:hypothetical protein
VIEQVKTFSPSATDAYSFCPRYWGFYRARLKPRVITYPEIAAIIGTSVAAGLEVVYKARMIGQSLDSIVYTTVAQTVAKAEMTAALAGGVRYVSIKDRDTWDNVLETVESVLALHARVDPFKAYIVESVEETGDFHDRTDLILRDQNGQRLVVDFKVKLTLRAEWIKKEQAKWARSWQQHHYAITRGTDRFAVALLCPKTRQGVYYEIVQVEPGYKLLWLRDAVQIWGEMDRVSNWSLEQLRGNTSHANEYGECSFWTDACSHGLDEAQMTANLVQVERVKYVGGSHK